jgi:hypothetical protein
VDWTQLSEYRGKWRAALITVIHLRVSYTAVNSLSG